MPREGHMKSVPGILLCPSTYHQPKQEKRKEMQSWLGHFEEGQTILWDALSPRPASLSGWLCTQKVTSVQDTEPHFSSSPVLKMGKYFFMVCCCSFLSQMPWDHRPLGTCSWVQAWLMLWSSKFSDLWMERWRGKLEKGKEKRNTLVWLDVCLTRESCVLSKVCYHLKTGLLCKHLASSQTTGNLLSVINALLHPPSGRMHWLELWWASWHLRAFAPAVPSV